MSRKLQSYLFENGILHYIACPYAPQQNGMAERRHRSVVEICLAQMIQAWFRMIFGLTVSRQSIFLCIGMSPSMKR